MTVKSNKTANDKNLFQGWVIVDSSINLSRKRHGEIILTQFYKKS